MNNEHLETNSVYLLCNKNNNNYNGVCTSEIESQSMFDVVSDDNEFFSNVEVLCSELCSEKNATGIYNLSSYTLSEPEQSLLNKGLKFCPTPPKPDIGILVRDLDNFFRNSAIKLHFSHLSEKDENSQLSDPGTDNTLASSAPNQAFHHPDLRPKSRWNPPVPPLLEHVKQLVYSDLQNYELEPVRQKNLSSEEFHSIFKLAKCQEIVIKSADKGSGIVIQNIDDYIREGERQLSDTNFYVSKDLDLTNKHEDKVKWVAFEMLQNDEITDKTYQYLTTNCDRTSQFYMLPKVHKSRDNPPGRPIISGNDSPTEKISHLIDVILQPYVPQIKSYVKDTTDFVNKIQDINKHIDTSKDIILCTLDVKSLYTNIPHDEGIAAVASLLQKERPTSYKPTNQSILKLLKMVLTMNNFQFNGKNYLQTNGTAMGTRVAPTYANIFMSHFEQQHVYTYRLQPDVWLRYIDDIFMKWSHGLDELLQFVEHLNSANDCIEFTIEWSRQSVPFLDTRVIFDPHIGLYTDLYIKPTDTHSYLRFSSCHPPHIMRGLPYSQFLRLRRICYKNTDFYLHALNMVRNFIQRGYPPVELLKTLRRVINTPRDSLLSTTSNGQDSQEKSDDITLYLIVEYNPKNPPLKDIIQKHWPILGRSSSTRPLVNAKIVFGHRRPKNLKDILVNAKLPTPQGGPLVQFPRCKSGPRCKHCPNINRDGYIFSHTTRRKFKCVSNGCCQSQNLIYCITCKHCGLQYVGQTKTSLKTRINNHRSTIRTEKLFLPVPSHMKTHGDTQNPQLEIHILEYIKFATDSLRAKQSRDLTERDWMARLNTLVPHGMNLAE